MHVAIVEAEVQLSAADFEARVQQLRAALEGEHAHQSYGGATRLNGVRIAPTRTAYFSTAKSAAQVATLVKQFSADPAYAALEIQSRPA